MELEGTIIQMNPVQTGAGKNGTWKKQEIILETKGQYPRKVCVVVWGDKIDQFGLQPNDTVKLSIELESREFNGRWYTDVRAWKAEKSQSHQDSFTDTPDQLPASQESTDDLPF